MLHRRTLIALSVIFSILASPSSFAISEKGPELSATNLSPQTYGQTYGAILNEANQEPSLQERIIAARRCERRCDSRWVRYTCGMIAGGVVDIVLVATHVLGTSTLTEKFIGWEGLRYRTVGWIC